MAAQPEGAGARRRTVLVVDDDPDNLDLVERVLHDRYEVLKALGARQAIALLAESEVHLLLADQRMHPSTGLELLRQARNRWPALPVVLMSAYADTDVLVEAINAGVSRFVGKPFRPGDLQFVVDSILGIPVGTTPTVLVVDDSVEVRELLTTALTRASYRTVCAGSADEAVRAIARHTIDLAIVDIALPGASGLELTAALKQTTPRLPIIIVSAVESVDVAIDALRLGVIDYVTKPFRFREILFRVDRALEMARRVHEGAPPALAARAEKSDRTAVPDVERPLSEVLQQTELAYLDTLLKACNGELEAVARRSGLPRTALTARLKRHGLKASDYRSRGTPR